MKIHLVLGASENPDRYSYKAVKALEGKKYTVCAVGVKTGKIDQTIIHPVPFYPETSIHTVTLYINPERQKTLYEYILKLKPERIIFNPGTENTELKQLATKQGIICTEACTLVLLATGQY